MLYDFSSRSHEKASCTWRFPALLIGKYLLVKWDGKCNIILLMTLLHQLFSSSATNEIMDLTSRHHEELLGNFITVFTED